MRKLSGIQSAPAPMASSRSAADTDNLVEIFFSAASEERRIILGNLDITAKTALRRSLPTSSEVVRRLETAALQHNIGEFSRTLERALGISRALAERIARDASGEPIVVAAKALGMKAPVLQRILLFLNPAIGQSVERVHNLSHFFDELSPDAAERMLTIWRKASARAAPVQARTHEPMHWDDDRRNARSLSSPSPQRVVSNQNGQPGRIKASER
jgi:hypothetical protein